MTIIIWLIVYVFFCCFKFYSLIFFSRVLCVFAWFVFSLLLILNSLPIARHVCVFIEQTAARASCLVLVLCSFMFPFSFSLWFEPRRNTHRLHDHYVCVCVCLFISLIVNIKLCSHNEKNKKLSVCRRNCDGGGRSTRKKRNGRWAGERRRMK